MVSVEEGFDRSRRIQPEFRKKRSVFRARADMFCKSGRQSGVVPKGGAFGRCTFHPRSTFRDKSVMSSGYCHLNAISLLC